MRDCSKLIVCLIIMLVADLDLVSSVLVMVCENEIAHLRCSPDQTIVVERVFYGRKDPKTCGPHVSLPNWKSECSSSTALSLVSSTCSHLSECHIHAMNTLFGDPCPTVFKVFEVEYSCINVARKSESVCETGVVSLQCSPTEVINVVSVFYGRRDKTTCTPHWSIANWKATCFSTNALELVSNRCNNSENCTVPANNELFSDPCPIVYKYLVVEYHCVQLPYKSVFTCEPGEVELSCPPNTLIKVKSVFYGRKDNTTCAPQWGIGNWKSECYSTTALDIVSNMCKGLRTCKVRATINVFSDPCLMVLKYLEIKYQCTALKNITKTNLAKR